MSGRPYGNNRRRSHQGKRPNSTPLLREWDACVVCGKRTWHSKKAAKAGAKQIPNDRFDIYPACGDSGGFHIGHVSRLVIAGYYTRSEWREKKGTT